jgi:hypothetical protein
MNKIGLISLAALAAAIATPAAAQSTTGTVDITGTVAAKCIVQTGSGTSSTFGTTVALGELAQADGTLKPSATLATTFNTVGGTGLSAKVICTTANPEISVNANPITSAVLAGAGYDNSIDFQADVTVTTLAANASPYSNDSAAAAGAATALGSRLANTASNVTIAASNFRTNNLTDLLVAATDYAGSIVVVIAPGA